MPRLFMFFIVLAFVAFGMASWYSPVESGSVMANGELFSWDTWCIAHKTLPLNSLVMVTSRYGTVLVRVCDRGPYGADNLVVDLAPRVADVLMPDHGWNNGVPYGMIEVSVWRIR